MSTPYSEPGMAEFYCPTLYKMLGNRHWTELSRKEREAFDGNEHSTLKFTWLKGELHIDDAAHDHLRNCSKCGKRMIQVAGLDAGSAQFKRRK